MVGEGVVAQADAVPAELLGLNSDVNLAAWVVDQTVRCYSGSWPLWHASLFQNIAGPVV